MRAALVAIPLVGLAAGALAADLPRRAVAPQGAPPLFSWTGVYSGVFAGYGLLNSKATPLCFDPAGVPNGVGCPLGAPLDPKAEGYIAGSEVGYNYQFTPGTGFVVGVAADTQFNRLRTYQIHQGLDFAGGGTNPDGVFHAGQRVDSLTTARGKIGYAFDRLLVYGTGGLAVANVRIDTNTVDQTFFPQPIGQVYNGVFDGRKGGWRAGYTVGGGLEYAFSEHLSIKGEALYFDLGSTSVLAADSVGGYPGYAAGARVSTSGVLTRVGLNYRFDDGGIPIIGPVTDVLGAIVNPQPYVPLVSQIWDFEVGARYFYSSGTFRKTLGDPFTPGQTNSRLTYRDFPAHSGETFARIEHNPTGIFAKGFFGSGFVTSGGKLNDEDFPPAVAGGYSNTVSKIRTGDIAMAVGDLGYDFLRTDSYKLGGFVGYQYFSERPNAFGCVQIATNPGICGGAGVARSVSVLTQDNQWSALRVGLAGEARYDRFKIGLEGAYLPIASLGGYDRHWLRPDINPLPEQGDGDGYFLQGIVSYDLTQSISIGVGARYMKMSIDTRSGTSQFPFAPASPEKFTTERYGAFAQMSYRFTDPDFGLSRLISK